MTSLLRIRKNVFRQTQAVMADIAGVDQSTWSRWERALLSPTLEELARIREAAFSRKLPWDDAFFFTLAPETRRQRVASQKRRGNLTARAA